MFRTCVPDLLDTCSRLLIALIALELCSNQALGIRFIGNTLIYTFFLMTPASHRVKLQCQHHKAASVMLYVGSLVQGYTLNPEPLTNLFARGFSYFKANLLIPKAVKSATAFKPLARDSPKDPFQAGTTGTIHP